jgi:hypothetical protein
LLQWQLKSTMECLAYICLAILLICCKLKNGTDYRYYLHKTQQITRRLNIMEKKSIVIYFLKQ